MKLRLNKLVAGLVLAGGALALVGCGGGDAPTLSLTENAKLPEIKKDAASVGHARSIFASMGTATFDIPKGTFNGINVDTTLEIKGTGSATGKKIADFTLKSKTGSDTVTGTVDAGSCEFTVPTTVGSLAAGTYTFSPCQLEAGAAGVAVGDTKEVTLTLILGNTRTVATQTVTLTVKSNLDSNGRATIEIEGVTITGAQFPTGSAPTGGQ